MRISNIQFLSKKRFLLIGLLCLLVFTGLGAFFLKQVKEKSKNLTPNNLVATESAQINQSKDETTTNSNSPEKKKEAGSGEDKSGTNTTIEVTLSESSEVRVDELILKLVSIQMGEEENPDIVEIQVIHSGQAFNSIFIIEKEADADIAARENTFHGYNFYLKSLSKSEANFTIKKI